MTTQPTSPSPFQDETKKIPPEKLSQEFHFQTMQDDLIDVQKKDASALEKATEKSTPNNSTAEIKAPTKPTSPFTQSSPRKENTVTANPFLDQATPVSSAVVKEMPKPAIPQTKPEAKIVELPTTENAYPSSSNSTSKTIVLIIILLIIGIFLLGGYYFWMLRSAEKIPAAEQSIN